MALEQVMGVPLERYPEPLRSSLQATVRDWPPDGLASAVLDEACRWVYAHRAALRPPAGGPLHARLRD